MKNYFNGYNAGPMDFGQPEQHKKDGNSSSAVTLLEEGGVRFRIYEQGVNSVKVQFDDEENEVRYPLVKDRDGYWSLELYGNSLNNRIITVCHRSKHILTYSRD